MCPPSPSVGPCDRHRFARQLALHLSIFDVSPRYNCALYEPVSATRGVADGQDRRAHARDPRHPRGAAPPRVPDPQAARAASWAPSARSATARCTRASSAWWPRASSARGGRGRRRAGSRAARASRTASRTRARPRLARGARVDAGAHSWDDDAFDVRFSMFGKTDSATRLRILEGRRTRLAERLEEVSATSRQRARAPRRATRQNFSATGSRQVEREVAWLDQLIENERSAPGGNNQRSAGPRTTNVRRIHMAKLRVAIVGVGNCATSLIQGVEFYKDAKAGETVPGLMHVQFGDYHISRHRVRGRVRRGLAQGGQGARRGH